ncbi:hypothetical protein ACFU6E_27915 [Bacillus cereus]|uniref:hypothetical protein n=1 Tax=Bacillus cereus TaxID=1396 RepID=UPI00367139AC
MKSIKRLIQVILVSTSFLILSGCFSSFSQDDLNQPIQEYLKTNYGIQDEFSVIRTDNTFNGIGHQTYVEIKKPYRAYPFLMIEKYTFKILEDESDDIYFQQFKGAYIEQHPEVVQVMKQIIKKYGLVKYPGKADPEENGPIGVVNFLFRFDMNKNKHPIPKAKDLIEDFQKSGVLTKGIYNIDMFVDDSNPDHFIGWEYNNVALFEVNENGKYTVIATPNYDDIRDTYFYGDYATKKYRIEF